MRPLFHLVLHALLAMLLLAAGSASAASHRHGAMQDATPVALAADARPAAPHAACDPHRHTGSAMATHGSTPRCRQACLALSAGFAAVLPVQVHALWLADGASARPDAQPTLPPGRVVMPERRPPRAI